MQLHYSLDSNDFLQHQLFLAAHNKRITNKRKREWLLLTVTFILAAGIFYQKDIGSLAFSCSFVAVITLLFYPLYQRSAYRKHYWNHINENYQVRFNQPVSLEITPEYINSRDYTGEGTMYLAEINNIIETGDYFFLATRSGGHILLPKNKISNQQELKIYLQSLGNKLGIPYSEELNWKWK